MNRETPDSPAGQDGATIEREEVLAMWLSGPCSECGDVTLLLGRRLDCARCERCIAGGIRGIRPGTVDLLAAAFKAQRGAVRK